MATCEMCGQQASLKKTKVEGTTLDLCEDCQEVGEVVGGSSRSSSSTTKTRKTKPKKTKPKRRSSSRKEPDAELIEDYNTRVKQARESKGMGVKDLAGKIKEKDSVIRRVESGKLAPDQRLARKLEGALGITLYEEFSEISAATEEHAPSEQTIGDVAEVRERN